jgi:hypothetical protein
MLRRGLLKRMRSVATVGVQGVNDEFASFGKASGSGVPEEQREALFREFLRWQKTQHGRAQR